ncbi:hypothetical protein Plhal304r1_c010g0038371 [Plasmopara halstedii]
MNSTPARKRHRTRLRDSLDNEDEDHALDAMLVELGIPCTTSRSATSKQSRYEVIELTTPSPPPRQVKVQNDGRSIVVDLTTSPELPSPSLQSYKTTQNVVMGVDEQESEVSFSYSPSASPPPHVYSIHTESTSTAVILSEDEPEILSPEITKKPDNTTRIEAKQKRRLSGRLRDLHSEVDRGNENANSMTKKTIAAGNLDKNVAHKAIYSTSRSEITGERTLETSVGVIAIVQMEKVLDLSEVGQKIRDALKNHMYNGKSVAFTVSSSLNCIIPGVIRWERKDENGSHYSCAIYFKADTFLSLILKSYNELIVAIKYLQTLVPTTKNPWQEEEKIKYFVIIEGMDRALIALNRQLKKNQKETSQSATSRLISFADLHEVAFQLFMDMNVHTKFTCDLEASADYVALLTRELIVASSHSTALEDDLESAPRYHSFRVLHNGQTASASANAWLRMLQVIPGVSEVKAQYLLNHFPTFHSLMQMYRDPNLSRAQKEDLVADKLHSTRIQRALSKRIFTVFCEANPDTMI